MPLSQRYKVTVFIIIAVVILLLCQWSSYLVEKHLSQDITKVITPYLFFTHVRNLGGIFGILQGKGWLFALVSVFFLVGLTYYLIVSEGFTLYEYVCYAIIIGGGSSNVADRIIYGSVIDFIDIRGIPHWNYIFNVADVMIHLGIWPLIIYHFIFQRDRHPKNDFCDETS